MTNSELNQDVTDQVYRHVWRRHHSPAEYNNCRASIPPDLRVKVDEEVEAKIVENMVMVMINGKLRRHWSIETNEVEDDL
jgi:hypothetical protein